MSGIGGWADGRIVLLGALLFWHPTIALAQDSTAARPTPVPAVDSAHPPIRPSASDSTRRPTTPMGAMFRSFALPGWGQAVYGRKTTAGIMIGFEGLTLGMSLKAWSEMRHIEATGSGSWRAKRQEQQDWMTLLIFNHLMSGLEAYVSAHLYDFPGDLEFRALPGGGVRAGVTLPLGPR